MNGRASRKKELPKRVEKSSFYRRVVTENVNDKSVVQSDEQLQAYEFKSVPNYEHTLIWVNPTTQTTLRKLTRIHALFSPLML